MGKGIIKFGALLVIYLMVFLPVSYAITIYNDSISAKNTFADFFWQTDNASTSSVDIGETPAYGRNFFSNNQVINHAVTATGLSPDRLYYYKIMSSDGFYPAEKTGTFRTPDATPPPIPSNFTAFEITKTAVSTSWETSSASDFSKFTLYRGVVVIYEGGETSFADTNLSSGTSYTYQASAWDLSGNEGQKAMLTATTKSIDFTAPIITNITITESTDTSAKISWKTDDNSTSKVYYRSSSGVKEAETGGYAAIHSVQIIVEKGKTVYYKVNSCNEDNICVNSSEYGFIGGKDVLPPQIAIYTLESTILSGLWYNSETISLDGKTEPFSYAELWVNGDYQGGKSANENGTINFTNIALKTDAQINTIKIRSTDPSGNSFMKDYKIMLDFDAPILKVSLPSIFGERTLKFNGSVNELSQIDVFLTTTTETPTGFNATASNQGVQLSWSGASTNYNIYRDDALIGRTSLKTFLDKDVVQSKYYNYQVSSLNTACDESAKTASARVYTSSNVTNSTNPVVLACANKPVQSLANTQANFSSQIDFSSDGTYIVKITAKDKAGNIDEYIKSIIVGTEKPMFSEISPGGSDWYYTDAIDSIDIRGKTTPNSTVRLWILKSPSGEPYDKTYSDANGNFKFEDVNFADITLAMNLISLTDESPSGLPSWRNESTFNVDKTNIEALRAWTSKNKFYYLQAQTNTGLKSDFFPSKFEIKTCYSGNFSWSIVFHPEYQSPEFLSVERLEEGTERMAFFFELKWVGSMASQDMVEIVGYPQIERADLDISQEKGKAYNLTQMIAKGIDYNSGRVCDPTNRKCYFIARPQPIRDLTANWGFDDWKQLSDSIHNELKLPIKVSVTYKVKDANGNDREQTQIMCKELSYALDNTKLDFSKLPDWLAEDGIKFLNTSIENLDKILTKSKPAIDAVGYVCIGSMLSRMGIRVVRILLEKFQYLKDRIGNTTKKLGISASSPCYKNYVEDETNNPQKAAPPADWMSRLSNEDLDKCYDSISFLWKAESKADWAYRYSCNRIYCKASPAKWTGDQYLPSSTIDKITSYDDVLRYLQTQDLSTPLECKSGETNRGMEMIKTRCDFKNEQNIVPDAKIFANDLAGKSECYILDDAYWAITTETATKYTVPTDGFLLKKVYKNIQGTGVTSIYGKEDYLVAMPVKGKNNDRLFTGLRGSCEDNCKSALGLKSTDKITKSTETKEAKENQRMINEMDYSAGDYDITSDNLPGNYADITTISQCRDHIIQGQGKPIMMATYGKDGGEFIDIAKSYQDYSGKKEQEGEILTCCCYSTIKDRVSTINIVNPYNNVDYYAEDNEAVKWDYRYSQTGYIYPIKKENKPADTAASKGDEKIDIELYKTYGQKTKKYNTDLYFDGRDYAANFGKNYAWDYFGKKQPTVQKLDPKSQHTSAIQTLCLTGIYKRLQLLRNVLSDIRSCIISAKYTGQYTNAVCKELFSQYICRLASDIIVSLGSGCSPFIGGLQGDAKTAGSDFDESLNFISAGVGSVTEGVSSSMTDFGEDYGNAEMSNVIQGGVGGVAEKACMAALGYDWELDITSMLDAAYATEYRTTMFAAPLSRRFLFVDPSRSVPVFEYRGSMYIAPGCDIDGFNAELVCVNRAEGAKYKDIKCSGTSDCACWISNQGMKTYQLPVSNSGKMTQGVPLDKAFHVVADQSNDVYDHLRVEFTFSDEKKKKACLPDGNQDGVFYYPFTDRTPLLSLGCEVVPSAGTVSCKSGIAKELGFGNLRIMDVEFNNNPNINVAVVGNTFMAYPILTKTGSEKMCLYWTVYKGEGASKTEIPGHSATLSKTIEQAYAGSKFIEGIPVFQGGNVPANLIGGGAQVNKVEPGIDQTLDEKNRDCQNRGVHADYFTQSDSESGSLLIHFLDGNGDGKINCNANSNDKYSLTGKGDSDYKEFPSNCIIKDSKGIKIGIKSITLDTAYCKGVTRVSELFTITNVDTTSSKTNIFSIEVMGGMPVNGDCKSGTRFSAQKFTKTFTVSRVSESEVECNSGNGVCKVINGVCEKTDTCSAGYCCVDKTAATTADATASVPTKIKGLYNEIETPDANGVYTLDSTKQYWIYIPKTISVDKIENIQYYYSYNKDQPPQFEIFDSNELTTKYNNKPDYELIVQKPYAGEGEGQIKFVIILKDKSIITTNILRIKTETKCGPVDGGNEFGVCLPNCGSKTDISLRIGDSGVKCTQPNKCCV